MLDVEEIDDLLGAQAVLDFFLHRRAEAQHLPEQTALHAQGAAGHDVVERGHAAEQRHVLERARNAAGGGVMRAHFRPGLAAEGDLALLRRIETVDNIEHRGLAGAVRSDDGADFTFADIKRHIADGMHAAERQRDILHREQNFPGRDIGRARRPHAAFPIALGTGCVFMSTIFTRAAIAPLRPSSKVTSVRMSASFEPSYSPVTSEL